MNDMENKRIIAENIQYFMNKCGKSRKDLCNDLGIKYTTLAGWLSSEKYPRIDKIESMANYFKIPKSDLIEKRASDNSNSLSFKMNPHEKLVVTAYHNHPDMQPAVDRLLGIQNKNTIYPVYNKIFDSSYMKVSTPTELYEIKESKKDENK
ncbi:MAG: helix-turn-helix transcriptional regulator [Lachnospiraceae bacterium]|nr:helix-turn-helix transcriptional regulator [Lachnospiraceae bacterium]